MEYTSREIHGEFLKARCEYMNDGGWSFPKRKLSPIHQQELESITKLFCTKWINVNPLLYFGFGFQLFGKNFYFQHFQDSRLINYYKEKIKVLDRKMEKEENEMKDDIDRSLDFIEDFCTARENVGNLVRYMRCVMASGGLVPAILVHFKRRKIDPYTMVFLMIRYKDEFKIFDEDLLTHYLGREFRRTMFRLRFQLSERTDVLDYLRKEVERLESLKKDNKEL